MASAGPPERKEHRDGYLDGSVAGLASLGLAGVLALLLPGAEAAPVLRNHRMSRTLAGS